MAPSLINVIAWFVSLQLNQQNQSAKGAPAQDYSFLNEASPIYVTSLTGNHVTGTTTLTTSNLSSGNTQQTSTTFVPPVNTISGSVVSDPGHSRTIQSIAHVHQPPASLHNKQQLQQTQTKVVNQQPLAGGWLIGESAQGTLITNDQQAFQNLLNNNTNSNNISVNSAGGTVVYSGNCISSTSETATNTALNASSLSGAASALASGDSNKYGNTSKTATSSELLANGHGPRREVSHQIRYSCNRLSYFFLIAANPNRILWSKSRLGNIIASIPLWNFQIVNVKALEMSTIGLHQINDALQKDYLLHLASLCFEVTNEFCFSLISLDFFNYLWDSIMPLEYKNNVLDRSSSYQHYQKVIQSQRKA